MIVTKIFSFDLDTRGISPLMYAVQGDVNTRKVEISLFSNGTAWEIPDGTVVAVAYRKPDGTSGLYDKLPSGESASEVSGNVVTVMLAPQVLTCAGNVVASVVFYSQDMADTLATFSFQIHVEKNPGAGQQISNNYYALQNLEQVNVAYNDLLERVLALEQGIGTPTDEQVKESVAEWLDEHPEATTTVQDGSITEEKLSDDVKDSLVKAASSANTTALTMQVVGQLFEKPDGRKYVGWPLGSVKYDAAEDTVNVLVNVADTHDMTNDENRPDLYLCKINPRTLDYTMVEIVKDSVVVNQTNADKVTFVPGTKDAYTFGLCIDSNGDYLFMPNYTSEPYLFRSNNHGASWSVTVCSMPNSNGNCFAGLMQTSTGRLIVSTHSSYFWYSDDKGANWTKCATPTTHTYGHEACIVELAENELIAVMRKRWQSTDNNAWNGTRQIDPAYICYSHDNGETWTNGVDSKTITEMSATGCAIAKIGDRLELYATSRYPHLDTMGVIYQHAASVEDALADNWSNGKVLTYSKAKTYDDFGYPGCCADANGNVHLFWYDGDADESGNTNYYYAQGYNGVANVPVNADHMAIVSPVLPYSAAKVEQLIAAVRAELTAKINSIVIENGGTVEDENFYVTDALKFDFDLTNTEKYDTDAGTITDTFGNIANTTFMDGAISANVTIPADTFAEKLTDTSQLTLELCVDVITPSATNNSVLLETTTYKYDYTPIKARQVFGLYTNSSGADSTTGAISIPSFNGTLSASTVGTTNTSQASLLYVSGTQHIVLTMDTDGMYVLYAKGEILHTGTIDDFGSWNALISRGIKAVCSDIYTLLSFRVYNKALTADEVMQNYNYCKERYG